MELPKRKANRLSSFDYSQCGAYFITICTKNKDPILCRIREGSIFSPPVADLSPVGQIVSRQIQELGTIYPHIRIDKYVIMPNHLHMIIWISAQGDTSSPANATIPSLVSTLKRFTNKSAGIDIWQRSYHDHIIRNEHDHQMIWQYIDNNPAKWSEDCFYTDHR